MNIIILITVIHNIPLLLQNVVGLDLFMLRQYKREIIQPCVAFIFQKTRKCIPLQQNNENQNDTN
jgi:hypothetical protein